MSKDLVSRQPTGLWISNTADLYHRYHLEGPDMCLKR